MPVLKNTERAMPGDEMFSSMIRRGASDADDDGFRGVFAASGK